MCQLHQVVVLSTTILVLRTVHTHAHTLRSIQHLLLLLLGLLLCLLLSRSLLGRLLVRLLLCLLLGLLLLHLIHQPVQIDTVQYRLR